MQQMKAKPIQCPPARMPRGRHASPSLGVPSANQVGRDVRAWLSEHAGVLCISIGWLLAFTAIAIPEADNPATAAVELGVICSAFFGFGIGWIVRDGRKR